MYKTRSRFIYRIEKVEMSFNNAIMYVKAKEYIAVLNLRVFQTYLTVYVTSIAISNSVDSLLLVSKC